MARALLTVPARVRRGEVFEIKALIAHPMETGFRPADTGGVVPRHIIERFDCAYNGVTVFRARLYPSITANPYFAFTARAIDSGPIECRWTDDRGQTHTETVRVSVE